MQLFRPPLLLLGLACLAAALPGAPNSAKADVRVWEDEEDPFRYLEFGAYLQPGYIYRFNDELSPLPQGDHFWLHRARFGIRSQLFPWLHMRLETETSPRPALTDAYLDFQFHPALNLRIGQFQLAFLRTFQFSESRLAFNDRTLFVAASPDRDFLRYLKARDVGMMLTGRAGADENGLVLQYWAGAFLGQGPNPTGDPDKAMLLTARAQLHLFGMAEHAEVEGDLARSAQPRLAFGAAVYGGCDERAQFNRGFTVDSELRYRGLFASVAFVRFNNGASTSLGDALGYGADSGCKPDPSLPMPTHVAWGASAQVQYVLPDRLFPLLGQALEVLARWDMVDPNSPADGSLLGGDESDDHYTPPTGYSNTDSPPTQWRLTFGLNWFPTIEQRLRFSLNYQHRREVEDVPVDVITRSVGIENDILWLQLTAGL